MILDGASLAAKRRKALANRVDHRLGLGIILATDNPPTKRYVDLKRQAAAEVGIVVEIKDMGAGATAGQLQNACQQFNHDPEITGYIVQLPLPSDIQAEKIIDQVLPGKDADGLTKANRRLIGTDRENVLPAPAKAVLELLTAYDIPIKDRQVVVVGKGWSAGQPIADVLRSRGGIVVSADSKTADLKSLTGLADILVSVTGQPKLITAEAVKEGAVLIDLGANRLDGKLVGDIDFDMVVEKASAITPVPGGVGPMTVISLLENVFDLGKNQRSQRAGRVQGPKESTN